MQYIEDYLKPSEVWFRNLRDGLDQAFSENQFFISTESSDFRLSRNCNSYFFTPVEKDDGLRFYLAQVPSLERRHHLLGFFYNTGDVSMVHEKILDEYDKDIACLVVQHLKESRHSDRIEGLDVLSKRVDINSPIEGELGRRIRDAQMNMMRYPEWVRRNSVFQGGYGSRL